MRVCVISSIFPPYSRGGAETVAYAGAQAFAQAGYDIFVITCAPFEGWRSFAGAWEKKDDLRVFRFTPLNLFSIFNIARYPKLLRLIWHALDMVNLHTYLVVRRILLKEKPDLILTHNLKGLGYSVHLAIHHSRAVKKRAKWIHTFHDMAALHPTGLKLFGREKSITQVNPLVALYAGINSRLLGDPDAVISPSQFLLDEYRARGFFPKSKLMVVRNPVLKAPSAGGDATIQGSSGRPAPHRRDPPDPWRCLYLGQLEPYKGLHLLLNVWQGFAKAHGEVELEIAGEGSMQEEVERAAEKMKHVSCLGFVPHEKLAEIFAQVNFTVIPSLAYENSPTAIGESFAHAIPVIASRIGGIPEIVEDGKTGFLFTPGDAAALRAALEQALQSKGSVLSHNALAQAENFSLDNYRRSIQALCGKS